MQDISFELIGSVATYVVSMYISGVQTTATSAADTVRRSYESLGGPSRDLRDHRHLAMTMIFSVIQTAAVGFIYLSDSMR